jgi:NADPH-dependent 2,4-dienoyl-CoA reductase/sulfur reductase-like enzyme
MLQAGRARAKYFGGQRLKAAFLGNLQSRDASSSAESVQNYDAVIIGGGPVGLALGCALSEVSI